MNIYDLGELYIQNIPLDDDLNINGEVFNIELEKNTIYKLEYTGYKGKMARYDRKNNYNDRPKLGYFDFRIRDSFGRCITHRELLNRLIECSSLENCYSIWNGTNIEDITQDNQEMIILTGLALCMLEQDINWGKNTWQKFTYFGNRGRDMIMGFVNYSFNEGVENIPHWKGDTPTFGSKLNPGTRNFRKYFVFEENPKSILSGNILSEFNTKIKAKYNNPS